MPSYAKYSGLGGSGGGGGGVSSLNSETGDINLVAGTGISVTPSGSNITIANTQTLPPFANTAFVNSAGNDSTGQLNNIALPFLTVGAAMASITNLAVLNQIVIQTPGTYSVDGLIFLTNVFIQGQNPFDTFLDLGNAGITIDTSWNNAGNNSGGVVNLGITSSGSIAALTFDFSAITGNSSFYFNNDQLPGTLDLDLLSSNSAAQTLFNITGMIQNKGNLNFTDCVAITEGYFNQNSGMNITSTGANQTTIYSVSSTYFGNVALTGFASGGRAILLMTSGSIFGNLNLTNSQALMEAQMGTLPPLSNITNSGTLYINGDAFGVPYYPAIPGNWPTPPANVTSALDDLAAAGILGPFTQGSIIFAGASALTQDNANLFWDDVNFKLGIGTNTPTSHLDVIVNDSTNTYVIGSYNNISSSFTGGTALTGSYITSTYTGIGSYGNIYGCNFLANSTDSTSAKTLTAITGGVFAGAVSGNNTTVTSLDGGHFMAQTGSSLVAVVATSMAAGEFGINIGSGDITVPNAYGVLIDTPTNGGSTSPLTNNYGLYVQDQSTSGFTNNYNIFSAGSAPNIFNGNVGIATSTPNSPLVVVGNVALGSAGTTAAGTNVLATGAGSYAAGTASFSGGNRTTARADFSIALGTSTDIEAQGGFSCGNASWIFADWGFDAGGTTNYVYGINGFSQNLNNQSTGLNSHSEGQGTFAGAPLLAFTYSNPTITIAGGDYTAYFADLNVNLAGGPGVPYAFTNQAITNLAYNSGPNSTTFDLVSPGTVGALAPGFVVDASFANAAHSEGLNTQALAQASHAGGNGTIAQADNQMAVGQFNVAAGTPGTPLATDEIFTVGNGANSGSRNTAVVVLRSGQVGVGTNAPDASSLLDVESTTQGFLPPQMTTTQKNAITSPKEGLVVYDLTLHKLSVFTGSVWETVTSV